MPDTDHTDTREQNTEHYTVPEEADEVDVDVERLFAPGHIEEWDMAVTDLRDALAELESVEWDDPSDLAEVGEIVEHRLSDIQLQFMDALESVRREEGV